MLEYVESVRRRPEEQRLTFFLVERDFQFFKIQQRRLWYFWHLQSSTQMLPQEKSRPARASARSETAAYADTWNQNLLLKIPYFTFKRSSKEIKMTNRGGGARKSLAIRSVVGQANSLPLIFGDHDYSNDRHWSSLIIIIRIIIFGDHDYYNGIWWSWL